MAWHGFGLALLAALSHSFIDTLRKVGSQRLRTTQLVTLVSLLDAIISTSFVAGQGGLQRELLSNRVLLLSACGSALLRLVSLVMYQMSITYAPISLAVPFLSFTPAMLVGTAYLFIGELPSTQGVFGVLVVALGGFALGFTETGGSCSGGRSTISKESSQSQVQIAIMSQENEPLMNMLPNCSPAAAPSPSKDREHSRDSSPFLRSGTGTPQQGGASLLPRNMSEKSLHAIRRAQHSMSSLPGYKKGAFLMLGVAAVWSITSSFDKLGLMYCPSFITYLAIQRAISAVPCMLYLLCFDFASIGLLWSELPLLLGVAVSELATVFFYLASLRYLLVSYAVATKRTGILLSVLSGWLVFKEDIRRRLPYIVLMLCGMLLIVFAPDHNSH